MLSFSHYSHISHYSIRVDYLEKFQQLIEEYNAGTEDLELFFTKLMTFIQQLNAEVGAELPRTLARRSWRSSI